MCILRQAAKALRADFRLYHSLSAWLDAACRAGAVDFRTDSRSREPVNFSRLQPIDDVHAYRKYFEEIGSWSGRDQVGQIYLR